MEVNVDFVEFPEGILFSKYLQEKPPDIPLKAGVDSSYIVSRGIWPLLAWGLVDDDFVDDVGDDDVDVDIISDKGRCLISAIS